MKKGKVMMAVMAMMATMYVSAQSLQEAIKMTVNEQYELADAQFKQLLQSNPANGEFYFYYGENFFKNNKEDLAKVQYQMGVDKNATNPLCYVGLGKVQWENNKNAEAKASFYKATTLAAGKNATVLMKIAEEYINADTKDLKTAFDLLTQAAKLEPKNPEVHILLGDMYLEQNDGSNAVTNYEKAGALDPKSVKATLRQGQLWNRAKNYAKALEFYKKASDIDSTFAPAYREKAEIYFRAGQYNNAVYNYKRYLQLNNSCSAKGRYAGFLNQAKQYKESIAVATDAAGCDPKNVYLYRYLAYDQFETGDFAGGWKSDSTFFARADSSVKIIPLDYEYKAKLLAKNNKDSMAALEYRKLLAIQPERIELNSDIANLYVKMKKYDDAIRTFKEKIEKGKPNANDYFGIGRAYYYSKDFVNADSAFAQLVKSQPDLGIGYFWRAKANSQLDSKNEKWLAKPFYETYITKIKPEEVDKNKKDLVSAYTYLGAYYSSQKDYCTAKVQMKKVIDLDASNTDAKKFLDTPEAKKCQ